MTYYVASSSVKMSPVTYSFSIFGAHYQKLWMTYFEEDLSKQNLILSKLFGLLSKNRLFLSICGGSLKRKLGVKL